MVNINYILVFEDASYLSTTNNLFFLNAHLIIDEFQFSRSSHCDVILSSNLCPFIIDVVDSLSIRNIVVTRDFLRSNFNAIIRLIYFALINARNLRTRRVDLVITKHLDLSYQFLTHFVLINAYKQAIDQVQRKKESDVLRILSINLHFEI